MRSGIITLLFLIVIGVIIADILQPKNLGGTQAVITGLGGWWKSSMNGLLGQTTN